MDMGATESDGELLPQAMDRTLLSQVVRKKRDRLIYQFDVLGDRAFFLELTEAMKVEPDKRYPAVTLAEGDAPDQYRAGAGSGSGSVFDDAMGDFSDFAGTDGYGDDE